MKTVKYIIHVCLLVTIFSCSSDDTIPNDDNKDLVSQICNTVKGPTALYWDYANGLPVSLSHIPLLTNPGQQFIHSQFPILGFTLPQGYGANEITNQQSATLGVNVLRNDNAVLWRYVPTSTLIGQINITDIMAFEINQMFSLYNFNGNFNVLCTTTKSINHSGITTTFSARLIQFGNFTGLVWVSTHFVPGTGNTYVTSSVSSGQTNEYDNLVMNVFLPISWQLIPGGGAEKDSDLDGTPDDQDQFPFDPTRQ